MLNGNSYCKTPNYLTKNEIKEICAFFQGAVYTWCAIKGSAKFSARNFIGGINYDWENTPLYKLYKHYESEGDKNPEANAGLDAGALLKQTLLDDKRSFKQSKNDDEQRSYYEWDKQQEVNHMIDEETKKTASELVNIIKATSEKSGLLKEREISEKYEIETEYGLGQNKEKGYIGRFFDIKDKLSIWAGYDPNPDYGFNISFSAGEKYRQALEAALKMYNTQKMTDSDGWSWDIINLNITINNYGNIQVGEQNNIQETKTSSSSDSKSKIPEGVVGAITIIASVLKALGL